ncbi:hypothetical protein BD560DRAFT_433212 [Blakeslea trispora]|nr:hypothetical protein BD560DRAFT_433212 [Blakeslea trispora]
MTYAPQKILWLLGSRFSYFLQVSCKPKKPIKLCLIRFADGDVLNTADFSERDCMSQIRPFVDCLSLGTLFKTHQEVDNLVFTAVVNSNRTIASFEPMRLLATGMVPDWSSWLSMFKKSRRHMLAMVARPRIGSWELIIGKPEYLNIVIVSTTMPAIDVLEIADSCYEYTAGSMFRAPDADFEYSVAILLSMTAGARCVGDERVLNVLAYDL